MPHVLPAEAAPESVRERIVATAAELFYRKGIRNVGIDEIIARAGIAKASLYKHFDSKDALIVEFLRRRDVAWREWFTARVAARATKPRDRLLAVFDVLGEWFRSDDFRGCAFMNAAIELANPGHAAHKVSVEHKRVLRTYLRGLAAEARLPHPELVAAQLALLAEGAIITALLNQSAVSARHARQAAATLIGER